MRSARAVFLDFDGTLADQGVVPEAHAVAIRAARARGHRVLLCTGRSKAMVSAEVLAIGFDGIVASAGGYVEVSGRVLADRRFPAPLAARALEVLDANGVAYLLEAPEAAYGRAGIEERILTRFAGAHEVDAPRMLRGLAVRLRDDLSEVSFAKITSFGSPVPIADITELIGPEVDHVPNSLPGELGEGGEIYLRGVHKAVGAAIAAQELGIPRERVVAVGDGMNDLELIDYAGLGVVIEGSDPRLVEVSDRSAPPPSRDGLATLFAELELV